MNESSREELNVFRDDFKCADCGGILEIMNIHDNTDGDGGTNIMAHCWQCDQTYVWTHPKSGVCKDFQKYYHG